MKFLKFFTIFLLVLLVVINPMVNLSFAQTEKQPTEKEINLYLQKAGYSEEVIAILEQPQKEYIYKEKLVYAYHKTETGNLKETNDNSNPEVQSGDVGIQSLSNWTATLVASRFTTPSVSGKVEFNLDYNWTWDYPPSWTLTDKFGIAWTDDFDAYPSTAVYAYRAFGRHVSSTGVTYAEYSTGNQFTYKDYTPGTGIGWEYDIISSFVKSNVDYGVYKHKGWGRIKIGKYSNKSGLDEQTSASASYFHKQGTLTGTLTFSPTPSISITNGWCYDKSPDSGATFSWNNYRY
ncbi:MAG TPA: hypothetical protein DDY49_03730 [Paenibacillaceae bacterium]|nr:hypothetical protein [Paenibacillaceae bacterium]